jgi:hypothetical protein
VISNDPLATPQAHRTEVHMKKTNLRHIKLSLSAETIRSLSGKDIAQVIGGIQVTVGGGGCLSEESQCQTARANANC